MHVVVPVAEATIYAGQVFYVQKGSIDLMRFTAAKDLKALHKVLK